MELAYKYMREVRDEARKNRVSVIDAVGKYMDAYHKHKMIHGSFKGVEHYTKRMYERYDFMRKVALEFIVQEVEKRKETR